jgi:hypothetical protein
MPPNPKPKLTHAQLRKAYANDLAAAWARARRAHANETPYAFVLNGTEGGQPPQLLPCLLTEESLTRVAHRYVDKGYHDTLDEARRALRYSVGDSPHVDEMYDAVPTVDALTAPHAKTLDDESGYAILAKAAIAALKDLDAQGLFGTGPERERLLLIIATEDTPKDWSKESARKLNPPAVFARFEAETRVEGTYAASNAVGISRDGLSLYSANTRANPHGTAGSRDEFINEIVAYDIHDLRLKRRWAAGYSSFGNSVRGLAVSPDAQSFVVLLAKYVDSNCHCTLMRFGAHSEIPMHQFQFVGEPNGLAQNSDGSRLAVSLNSKTLHLFDADFRPLGTPTFDHNVYRPLFLNTGELLIPTDRAILRLSLSNDAPATVAAPLRSFHLATNAADTILAVGRWFALSGPERLHPLEFGIHLLRLPTFEPLRTILIPGHQAVFPALSPDGRLLAFEAHELAKVRKFVAVYETATGREIARRKSNFIRQLAFLPDNQTLAIASSQITTGEPIDLWPIPHEP